MQHKNYNGHTHKKIVCFIGHKTKTFEIILHYWTQSKMFQKYYFMDLKG